MSTFAALGVPDAMADRLARRGITEPFPIQAMSLPDALAGRDLSARAPTGSGKTLAFGLAIAVRDARGKPRRPRSLVLVPTRELANQVAGEIQLLGPSRQSGDVVAIYGGASYGPQRKALSRGASVVVACPGRLEDLVAQGDVELGAVDLVVVDEADRLADMGFLPAVRRLLDRTRPERQTLLYSATLDGDVDALVRRYQRDPVRHEVLADERDGERVEHLFWQAEQKERLALVGEVALTHGQTIVFCRTRHGADRLAKQLKTVRVSAQAIHGNRTQGQRERALAAFAAGKVQALVATDVAARGIHVDDVACVVHFDLPADSKDYIHRSGRTGRAGSSGTVVSLVPREQRKALRSMQRALGMPERLDQAPVVVLAVAAASAPAETDKPQRTGRPTGSGHNPRRPAPGRGDHATTDSGQRRRTPRPANGRNRRPGPGEGHATKRTGAAGRPQGRRPSKPRS